MQAGADKSCSHFTGFEVLAYMIKSFCFRAVNSIEFLGIVVLAAVVLTSVTDPAKAERDPSIKQQSLIYSHLVSVQPPAQLPAEAAN